MKFKKLVAFTLATIIATAAFSGCTSKDSSNVGGASKAEKDASKPATWIADRHIVIRTFNSDLSDGPSDMDNNPVSKKIKELTGITYEVQYTSGPGSLEALTTAFTAGNMPDAIIYYLNNSARPEFPVVLKGAKEGVLTDLAPYLKNTQTYKKYYDESWMPTDAYKNIIQREELKGGTFHVQMRIERELGSNDQKMRGGLWIQKSIKEALKINPWDIKTSQDLYELAKKIKDGNFKDSYGNPVTPIGPSYWGGANDMPTNVIGNMSVGEQSNSFAYFDGKLMHETETPYVMNQINYVRKLISEGLMHKETLTMEENRAKEGANSYSWGIIEDVHSREDLHKDYDYVPMTLNNLDNEYVNFMSGKAGYGAWSVPTTTKNPEEIVKFADFMASKQGKLLWNYGIEGEHYTIKDGKVMVADKMMAQINEDPKFFKDLNICAGGIGSQWGRVFGETDLDDAADFGETQYGLNVKPDMAAKPMELFNYGLTERPYEKNIYKEGFSPLSYLSGFDKGEELKPLLDSNAYHDIRVKAVFAKTEAEAKKIMDDYLKQMNKIGLQEFKQKLDEIHKNDVKMLFIEEYKTKL